MRYIGLVFPGTNKIVNFSKQQLLDWCKEHYSNDNLDELDDETLIKLIIDNKDNDAICLKYHQV